MVPHGPIVYRHGDTPRDFCLFGIEEGEKVETSGRWYLRSAKNENESVFGQIAKDLVEEVSVIELIYHAAEKFAPEYAPDAVFQQIVSNN